jgi:uncharacterized protein (TIGR02246 family)
MKFIAVFSVLLFATICVAQSNPDETTIRNILQEEVTTWNAGDANGYSRHFADDGTFTNILGIFYKGHKEFLNRHDIIFKGPFRGTVLRLEDVSVRFIKDDVAIVEVLASVSGFTAGPTPGARLDESGSLKTRLLQVFVKQGGDWKIAVYHNVDVKPQAARGKP